MIKTFSLKSLVIIMSMLLLHACSSHDDDPAPQQNYDPVKTGTGDPNGTPISKSIGASGGTLQSADGKLTLTIPEGALTTNTTVSIQPITNQSPLGLGSGYRLSPEGTTFAKPVELKFHYDNALLGNTIEDFLWITTQNADDSWSAMLKSLVDPATKTVTVNTTHFSDWTLGRFIDLTLTPSAATLMVGKSVSLKVFGFVRDQNTGEDDDLAPLVPVVDDGLEHLAPLTTIPPVESRYMQFRVKSWALNGTAGPVSNKNGTLKFTKDVGTYTAPDKKPSPNVVAVSVDLETTNKEGKKSSYMLVSNITIIDDDYYLKLTVDGTEYTYYQYGFNGQIPPDPNTFQMFNAAITDQGLSISAAYYADGGSSITKVFLANFENPTTGSQSVRCIYDDSTGDVAFSATGNTGFPYVNSYVIREKNKDNCDTEYTCSDFTLNITSLDNSFLGEIMGSFSGTLREDSQENEDNCKTPISHSVSGEFRLANATL